MLKMIAALDERRGIANDHGIPWQGKIPGDVAYYRDKVSSGGKLLMGYGLYKELSRPYPGGINYVASSGQSEKLADGFEPITDAVEFIKNTKDDVWNLGGAMLFASTLDYAEELYITQLKGDFGCTKFFPNYTGDFALASASDWREENGIKYRFEVWKRTKAVV